ncbi:hypothetical protein EKO27_g11918 [Xylaria grammica]|uniref:Uncharacterized protein n=1 Tax=Xylaria grammica TaxID=363999 RepID=A0A439CLZ9_9PEZI|nr:hypothetical protein EKO27_g11918 [Xylaria grammica]
MGRHEPLTSLALGRSPYDDVVEGEGEADPQEPVREYDEHGRVFNQESKRLNKDIIRAHNEVMLVIGVAEPDPGGSSSSSNDPARLHNEYENSTGRHFLRLGRVLVVAGIWGVHGVRQRILVYKETARFPFLEMMQRERKTHGVSQLLFSGMPSFFGAWSLQWYSRTSEIARDNLWLRAIFLPVYHGGHRFQSPRPLGDADREIRHVPGPEADGDSLAMNSEGVGEPLPVGTIRRQGTFSSRGGDGYATDEEEPEMANPTLISFDVDMSDSTEPPVGGWSAELRPSNSGDSRNQEKEAPKYMVNTLTSLPSLLAGDIVTSALTHALLTPFDILAFRSMARAFSLKFGLPMGDMFEVNLADGLVARMMFNLCQAEVLKFVICFGTWAMITGVAQRFHVTDEEWKEFQYQLEHAPGPEEALEEEDG